MLILKNLLPMDFYLLKPFLTSLAKWQKLVSKPNLKIKSNYIVKKLEYFQTIQLKCKRFC